MGRCCQEPQLGQRANQDERVVSSGNLALSLTIPSCTCQGHRAWHRSFWMLLVSLAFLVRHTHSSGPEVTALSVPSPPCLWPKALGTVPHRTKGHRWLGGCQALCTSLSHAIGPAGPPHSPCGMARRHPPLAPLGRGLDGVNGEQRWGKTQHPHPDPPAPAGFCPQPQRSPPWSPGCSTRIARVPQAAQMLGVTPVGVWVPWGSDLTHPTAQPPRALHTVLHPHRPPKPRNAHGLCNPHVCELHC